MLSRLSAAAAAAASAGPPLKRSSVAIWLTGLMVALASFGALAAPASAAYPTADPFYSPPAGFAAQPNGAILRTREVLLHSGALPASAPRGWQVLYRTTDRRGRAIATVATVMLPRRWARGPRKLVSYQTAYDGLSPRCRPSYSLRTGAVLLQATETISIAGLLDRGWAVVTADYEGPDDNWGVATTTARGVLDGVRAAQDLPAAGLDGRATDTVLWGYSGGGNATAWAGEELASYAPDLKVVGLAQGGVAPDLLHLVRTLDGGLYAGVAFAGIAGITPDYPEFDLTARLNRSGRAVFKTLRSRGGSCITEFVLRFAGQRFSDLTIDPGLLDSPEVQRIAAEQRLGQRIPSVPTLWYHTTVDEMKSYQLARALARRYCAAGTPVRFVTSSSEEHLMQFTAMALTAGDWIAARFAGRLPRTNCSSI